MLGSWFLLTGMYRAGRLVLVLVPPPAAAPAPAVAGVVLPDGLLQEVLRHLDLLAAALDGDHPLLVVVGLAQSDVCTTLSADPADSLSPRSQYCSGHRLVNGDLLGFFLPILVIFTKWSPAKAASIVPEASKAALVASTKASRALLIASKSTECFSTEATTATAEPSSSTSSWCSSSKAESTFISAETP